MAEFRRIVLCADDYGLSPGVNRAIRDLLTRGRINATSVMMVTPAIDRAEADALASIKSQEPNIAIGLHVTLTAPFRPLTADYAPLRDGALLSIGQTLGAAMLRRLRSALIAAEIRAQIEKFTATFGAPPDYLDGHQHVQIFPQVRDAFLEVVSRDLPKAWVRQCGRVTPVTSRLSDRKGLLLDILSAGFRTRAARLGVRTNPAFAGSYDFHADPNFAVLFPRFLDGLPADSVVMCHPGFVDDMLKRLDPLTDLREREYAFFSAETFPKIMAANRVTLA
ncbi:ChbG/HpnK family deacetylase [Pseudorhodoplanes sinuspersici]|uniref:Uncharacterized protein n=1 Tax=Pseudorhodoplanes sinuspersici TaxID=1235591 RepID=A0A1W6ZRI0_9HYPH|nr:ChbG/HpnK family deacetylase [Pseudorhodoplanes sinuspersici]ARP99932.1 hypothetical protein CAK95_13185 [Pseudorhodoplanes sinuspersici]RKE70953.1 hypothetical protein DFP91_3205 [Pseudorhodoplanes sinuspersici]